MIMIGLIHQQGPLSFHDLMMMMMTIILTMLMMMMTIMIMVTRMLVSPLILRAILIKPITRVLFPLPLRPQITT